MYTAVSASISTVRPGKKKSCLVVLHRPPLIFKNWEKVFTVQKYAAPNFQNSKKSFFFFENFDLLKIFLSCFQLVYILILVLNLYKDIFGKVHLFAPLLGDIEAIIPCSFDFDLKKKKKSPPARPFSKNVVEDNRTIISFRPKGYLASAKGWVNIFTSNGRGNQVQAVWKLAMHYNSIGLRHGLIWDLNMT